MLGSLDAIMSGRRFLAAYFVALHLFVFVVLAYPGSVGYWLTRAHIAAGLRQPNAPSESDFPARYVWQIREFHRWGDKNVPLGATVFLGDSITQALPVAAVAQRPVNYGIAWQTSAQLLEHVDSYKSLARATRVVIMIGTNDITQGRMVGLAWRYDRLLAAIPPGPSITLLSPPPLAKHDAGPAADAARASCAKVAKCIFVDAYKTLSSEGSPKAGVLLPDGIHLSPSGYALLIQAMQSAE